MRTATEGKSRLLIIAQALILVAMSRYAPVSGQISADCPITSTSYSPAWGPGATYELGTLDAYSEPGFTTMTSSFEAVALPFTFRFYDEEYDVVYISSNGFVSFSPIDNASSTSSPVGSLPSASAPFPAIYAFWADFDYSRPTGEVKYSTVDADTWLVAWHDVVANDAAAADSEQSIFELVLYSSGDFEIHLNRMLYLFSSLGTNEALIGWQDKPTRGVTLCGPSTTEDPLGGVFPLGACDVLVSNPGSWNQYLLADISLVYEPSCSPETQGGSNDGLSTGSMVIIAVCVSLGSVAVALLIFKWVHAYDKNENRKLMEEKAANDAAAVAEEGQMKPKSEYVGEKEEEELVVVQQPEGLEDISLVEAMQQPLQQQQEEHQQASLQ
jgi:hypothetical protein